MYCYVSTDKSQANQQEAIADLNKWIEEFIQTLNEDDLTDDQRLMINGYRIAFCGSDDNSDVENVLAIEVAFLVPSHY